MQFDVVRTPSSVTRLLGVALLALLAACGGDPGQLVSSTPHVDHVNLPTHKTWRVISVQPYEGLEDVELVRVDWPTAQDPRMAFALTKEGLEAGDAICLDHVQEIDTFWAHPVPEGGCGALNARLEGQ
jgi:hypothetical protein